MIHCVLFADSSESEKQPTKFTPEQIAQLEKLWNDGMQGYGSEARRKQRDEAVTLTGLEKKIINVSSSWGGVWCQKNLTIILRILYNFKGHPVVCITELITLANYRAYKVENWSPACYLWCSCCTIGQSGYTGTYLLQMYCLTRQTFPGFTQCNIQIQYSNCSIFAHAVLTHPCALCMIMKGSWW